MEVCLHRTHNQIGAQRRDPEGSDSKGLHLTYDTGERSRLYKLSDSSILYLLSYTALTILMEHRSGNAARQPFDERRQY